MMRKIFTAALLTAGATLALAPAAHADSIPNAAAYNDATANFVNALDPAIINAKAAGKQVIASTYGLSHPIYCAGTAPNYTDCVQHDDFGWFHLQRNELPQIGTAWVHFT